ncbi:MAG: hypothetical protein SFU27_04715 [Thermonemataceae bacterium]|nr:hypothetical protein [Thermonemataceae bacterium]
MSKVILILLLFFTLEACQMQSSDKHSEPNYYYNLEKELNHIVERTLQRNIKLTKITLAEGRTQKRKLSNINLKKELDFFFQANINKSSLQGRYEELLTRTQDTLFKSFIAKDKNLKVDTLTLCFKPSGKELIGIRASMFTENYLYTSHKKITLYCSSYGLKRYSIQGEQKMLLAPKENFVIEGYVED